jgi:hypothetical protein
MNHTIIASRNRQRLLSELEASPPDRWEVLAFLGQRDLFPGTGAGSVYRLHLRCGRARWWTVEETAGQRRGYDATAEHERAVTRGKALSPDRVVRGGLAVLVDLDFHPDRPLLGEVLSAARRALAGV